MVDPKLRLRAPHRRHLIEEAASALFAESGYGETTLDQIAAAAGVTKPVVYQHFQSKEDLHRALLAKHRDELLSEMNRAMTGQARLEQRVRLAVDAWFRYVESHPYAWRMLFRETTGTAGLSDFHDQMRAAARATLVALMTQEPRLNVPAKRRELVAELLRSAMVGAATWWLANPGVPRTTLVDAVVQVFWDGLRPHRARAP